ncbi:hypothetical protein SDJN02_25827, partial [Cucurbita argyrosperma subsp. argyrosperma]
VPICSSPWWNPGLDLKRPNRITQF